ncbi:MAG: glycosyltransferase family 2 protein [Brevinemataceae bacterium]
MTRQLPCFEYKEFFLKKNDIILLIPTWNEGIRIQNQLRTIKKHKINEIVDIILMDGGTTDGSIDDNFLQDMNVRGVFTVRAKGQGNAYRVGFAKAVDDTYKYCLTVDGNNKDNVEIIPQFIDKLNQGYDFVQGSRFMEGGYHENTPKAREIAIKYFSNPLLSLVSGFKYTETMSAFRGFNVNILKDERLQIFRDVFQTWELQWYIASRVPKLGYKVIEIPQSRIYPPNGPIPTKINWIGNFRIISQLLKVATGYYNPKS